MNPSRWLVEHHDVSMGGGTVRHRRVTLGIPPGNDLMNMRVVYCADGQVVNDLVIALQQSPFDGALPLLVGVHSHPELRAQEYLLNSSEQFLTHEKLFVQDVRSWANSRLGISVVREKSAVFGFSNGGAFALATALRHANSFAAAIAFSVPAFGPLPPLSPSNARKPSIYLATGNQGPEKSIRKNMLKVKRSLDAVEIPVAFCERTAGHSFDFWKDEFFTAIGWLSRIQT